MANTLQRPATVTSMLGPYIHRIDPIIADVGGVHLWWYGLSYALGFLSIHLFLRRHRHELSLTLGEVYALTLMCAVGVLVGGRAVEVSFDEWGFYRQHPELVPALWLGGMATHGLLIGAAAGTWLFATVYRKPFLELADALAVPGALLMGIGRIGNFIDGQIVGHATEVWWAVKFPYAEGFRHPVVLYDGAKNLLLMPYLSRVRRTNHTPGATAARFVFWYAFPRIFIDLFRDYPTHRLALGTGQTLNLAMAALGIVLLIRSRMRRLGLLAPLPIGPAERGRVPIESPPHVAQRVAFVGLLLFCLTIPSNWTQDVPAHYSERHEGLRYSLLYPHIDTAPPAGASTK
jgi:phosphatidylglycerol:prolipoprotein diacylglycerol transferase